MFSLVLWLVFSDVEAFVEPWNRLSRPRIQKDLVIRTGESGDVEGEPYWKRFEPKRKKAKTPRGEGSGRGQRGDAATLPPTTTQPLPSSQIRPPKKKNKPSRPSDVTDIEKRMMQKFSFVSEKDGEFYDADDEGFEDDLDPQQDSAPETSESRRFTVKEPTASFGGGRERPSTQSSAIFGAAGRRRPTPPPPSTSQQQPPSSRSVDIDSEGPVYTRSKVPMGERRHLAPGYIDPAGNSKSDAPLGGGKGRNAALQEPPEGGGWGDLWDADSPLPATQAGLDEKKASGKKKLREELLNDVERGIPLTLEAVAARFRSRNETSSESLERPSLFVLDSDAIPNFSTLIDTAFSAATSTMESSRPQEVVVDGNLEKSEAGEIKATAANDGSGGLTGALLMRNLLAELSMRAASSGTRAVELSGAQSLRLDSSDLLALEEHASELRPTRVQADSAEALASGRDVLLGAPTGSGKTLAFLVPLLARLVSLRATKKGDNKVLVVIAPSRELAVQIAAVCSRLLEGSDLRCQALIGGANINRQLENLKKKKPQVLVGTAGRLAELSMARGKLKLKGNTMAVVIDEVDCMLGPPHRVDLEALLNEVGSSAQLVAASATGAGGTSTLREVSKLLAGRELNLRGLGLQTKDPLMDAQDAASSNKKKKAFNVSPLPSTVEHGVLVVPQVKMLAAIKTLLNTEPYPEAAIVFVNDGRRVELVCEKLLQMNIVAAPLHGEATKDDRSVIMSKLNSGSLGLVVTTELAARGLDAPILSHVINLDLPTDSTHYAHRAGRVGRAGRAGIVVTFATPQTAFVVAKFASELNVPIPRVRMFANQLLVLPPQSKSQRPSETKPC